ncbi:acyltransferase family protein [Limosilactobacillus mucosae]|uniref:acyltransferase family protein n=1 Tax=Limosilactobacillus mucosae TaxID=97478 RepID=UPI00087FDB32|nr:acyltransferase family protein [Limosilactobacillus mucosae]SDN27989.1 peptidoglycan-N-acetylmuramate O-acetyltransferase [Limosilactobacillus mucosae]SEK75264.1 peptidoglycan-N-acetylmuramate O-acetyltransferase [Limosilactobacillus mucosae]SFK05387.1 peptidoglycan-N-acetylmuramate O-acetyltransferase [Limosilactobacillus mucosae]
MRSKQYVTGIDGVRTLAVLGVIIYHLLPTTLPGGYLGVPLFLLISGYFVTLQLVRQMDQTGGIQLTKFYLKRLRRLYPVLIVMLTVTTAYITLFARDLLHNIKSTIATNLLWVYNWWEIGHGQSYFDRFNGESPFTHLWTLGVEAQFYFLWPLILFMLFLILRKRSKIKWAVFILAAVSAVEMALLFDPQNINRVYYGTDTRAFSLLLGSWLALCWPIDRLNASLTTHAARILDGVGIGALLIMLLGFFTLPGQSSWTYRGGMFFYSLIGMILIATVVHPGSHMNRWLTNPFFTWIGQRSYGIYVYQLPVMVFYERVVEIGRHPVINALVECLLILAISEFSYRLVEQPLAHYQWRYLPASIRHWIDFKMHDWHQWLKVGPVVIICFIALCGLMLPSKPAKKSAVQTRIEKSRQATAAKNKQIAKRKTAKVNVNSKSLQKKYGLTSNQLKAASELKVTAIGDSVMADASQDIQEIMPHAYVDAEVGRQGSATPAVIKDLKAKRQLQKNVILNLGTNGAMDSQTINDILTAIGKDHQVYWITPHVPTRDWEQTVCDQIKQAAKQNANVHVIDWNQAANGHAEWFAQDKVHMNEQGNAYFTRLIVKTILKNK